MTIRDLLSEMDDQYLTTVHSKLPVMLVNLPHQILRKHVKAHEVEVDLQLTVKELLVTEVVLTDSREELESVLNDLVVGRVLRFRRKLVF
jgi:hypothetical protein